MGDECAFFYLFCFVQYTGRLLTQKEKREIFHTLDSHLLIPVFGQEVSLLVLGESQKHLVYPGLTDLSLASLTSKCRGLGGFGLGYFIF